MKERSSTSRCRLTTTGKKSHPFFSFLAVFTFFIFDRYMAEYSTGEVRKDAAEHANAAYQEASKVAEKLPSTHPVRLGLALNYSVFNYEM